jgi:DNA (cytosine-5)-methyltransferase 1
VLHGGPPCQPFSTAGKQQGKDDARDMFPEFVRAVREIKPRAFVAENVAGLGQSKFAGYLQERVIGPLTAEYRIEMFYLTAAAFGVPQNRRRLIFIGLRRDSVVKEYKPPQSTHSFSHLLPKREAALAKPTMDLFTQAEELPQTLGVRTALGLPPTGFDSLSPTIRCTLTGPRHTTSIVSSVAALKIWNSIEVWPNGVSETREKAQGFPAENGHYRLSVEECALLQGFPRDWVFTGAVYKALGQVGNSVAPPMAYAIACSLLDVLS